MEQPHKRRRISVNEISEADLHERRVRNDMRLKSELESIFEKYSKDFSGVGDIIDFNTGEIVVDHGHVSAMKNEKDPGRALDMDDELGLPLFSASYGKASRKASRTKINFQSFKDSLYNSAADTSEASWQSTDELGLEYFCVNHGQVLHKPSDTEVEFQSILEGSLHDLVANRSKLSCQSIDESDSLMGGIKLDSSIGCYNSEIARVAKPISPLPILLKDRNKHHVSPQDGSLLASQPLPTVTTINEQKDKLQTAERSLDSAKMLPRLKPKKVLKKGITPFVSYERTKISINQNAKRRSVIKVPSGPNVSHGASPKNYNDKQPTRTLSKEDIQNEKNLLKSHNTHFLKENRQQSLKARVQAGFSSKRVKHEKQFPQEYEKSCQRYPKPKSVMCKTKHLRVASGNRKVTPGSGKGDRTEKRFNPLDNAKACNLEHKKLDKLGNAMCSTSQSKDLGHVIKSTNLNSRNTATFLPVSKEVRTQNRYYTVQNLPSRQQIALTSLPGNTIMSASLPNLREPEKFVSSVSEATSISASKRASKPNSESIPKAPSSSSAKEIVSKPLTQSNGPHKPLDNFANKSKGTNTKRRRYSNTHLAAHEHEDVLKLSTSKEQRSFHIRPQKLQFPSSHTTLDSNNKKPNLKSSFMKALEDLSDDELSMPVKLVGRKTAKPVMSKSVCRRIVES